MVVTSDSEDIGDTGLNLRCPSQPADAIDGICYKNVAC